MYMYIVDIRLKIFHYGKYIVKVLRIQEIASKRACSYVILQDKYMFACNSPLSASAHLI